MKRIRYIAVVDNIDFNGRITSIDIPIKVVMNDNYSMETSNNVRAALKAKAQRGGIYRIICHIRVRERS